MCDNCRIKILGKINVVACMRGSRYYCDTCAKYVPYKPRIYIVSNCHGNIYEDYDPEYLWLRAAENNSEYWINMREKLEAWSKRKL